MCSEELKRFLDFIAETQRRYESARESMETEDKRLQDLLHEIEFEPSSKNRGRICTRLHNSRKERRRYKDLVQETEEIVQFFQEPQHKKTLDQMAQLLGRVRKVEKYHRDRAYCPKVKEE